MAFRLYASPAYLATTKEADWRFMGYDVLQGRAPPQAALEKHAAGRLVSLHASSNKIHLAATRAGAGIAALPDFMARAGPGLKQVLAGAPLLWRDVWLVVHSDLKRSAVVRTSVQTSKRKLALSAELMRA